MDGITARACSAGLLASFLSMSGCSVLDGVTNAIAPTPRATPGQVGNVTGFLGGVVADEPQAALTGRAILSAGGNAADAATAMGLMLSVTLPSRAGLGSSGGCLAYAPDTAGPGGGAAEALLFPAIAPLRPGNADRPASPPMLARGLFALQAKYGVRPFETLISPAEQAARFGLPVSRALVADLAVVAGPLGVDPAARAVFFKDGHPLAEGDTLVQPDLGSTFSQLRTGGVGDLYQGQLARRLEDAMPSAGGGLTVGDLRAALPRFVTPITLEGPQSDTVAFLPLPLDGGLATAGAFQVLVQDRGSPDPGVLARAQARALGLATAARRGTVDPAAALAAAAPAPAVGPLPASTSFAALDRDGNAVVCAVSMGNLFGTGRVARGTGVLLAASPIKVPQPLLSAALAFNSNLHAFHAMSAGSGQEGAPVAAAFGLLAGLGGRLPASPPEPGRANVIACTRYLPDTNGSCGWSTDPRGYGIAVGSN